MKKLFMLAAMVVATSTAFAQDVKSVLKSKTTLRQSLNSTLVFRH